MKLYFSPGACSLSPHIVLRESGLAFTPVKVNLRAHQLDDGGDFYSINPKGYVPVSELDDGTRLTEGPAIVQYIADKAPAAKLAPENGIIERYQAAGMAELHHCRSSQAVLPVVRSEHRRRGQDETARKACVAL